jgi:hypothetical protein
MMFRANWYDPHLFAEVKELIEIYGLAERKPKDFHQDLIDDEKSSSGIHARYSTPVEKVVANKETLPYDRLSPPAPKENNMSYGIPHHDDPAGSATKPKAIQFLLTTLPPLQHFLEDLCHANIDWIQGSGTGGEQLKALCIPGLE